MQIFLADRKIIAHIERTYFGVFMRYIIFIFILLPVFLSPTAQAYDCVAASDFTVTVPTLYANPELATLYEEIGDTYTTAKKRLITCTNTDYIMTMNIGFFAYGLNIPNQAGPDGNQIFLGNAKESSGIIYNLGFDADCGMGNWVKPGSNQLSVCPETIFSSVAPKVKFYQRYTETGTASSVMRTLMGSFQVIINGSIKYSIPAYFTAFNVISAPCKITTKSVSVPLGNINKGHFSDVFSTAGGTDFNISMQCTQSTKFTLQIDSNGTSPQALLGLIPITTGADAASGVAIQLINNQTGNPFAINRVVRMDPADIGLNNISLRAQYMQIDETITPGTANGSATFTVRYQ